MKSKWLTLIELILYVFIVSFVWLYVVDLSRNFFTVSKYSSEIKTFSKSYNSLLKNIYNNKYDGWYMDSFAQTWLIMVSDNLWKYMWYRCFDSWFAMTYKYNWTWDIVWDNYDKIYTWFDCINLTWMMLDKWYWIDIRFSVVWRKMSLKYYLN